MVDDCYFFDGYSCFWENTVIMKITIGAGSVGASCAEYIALKDFASRLH